MHKVWRRFGVIVFVLAGFCPEGFSQENPLSSLDEYVRYTMQEWSVPGLALAVVQDDEVVWAKGYGVKRVDTGEMVDADTVFAVASLTKAFTATALGMLVQDGLMTWDDLVQNHLEGFRMFDPVAAGKMTVRDLLAHRSGLGSWHGDLIWYGSRYSRGEILRRLAFLKPEHDFRTAFGYSNLMYLIAGELLSKASGKEYDDFLKERLLDPLNMRRTKVSFAQLEQMDNVAIPHTLQKGKPTVTPYVNIDNIHAAASIISCVKDMANWIRMQLSQGSFEGRQIVKSDIIKATHQSQILIPLNEDRQKLNPWTHFNTYGLGWGIGDYQGRKVVSHSGALNGMFSYLGMLPEENLGVVVLTNLDQHAATNALVYHIFDLYLSVAFRDWNKRYFDAQKKDPDGTKKNKKPMKPSHTLRSYTGTFTNCFYGDVVVKLQKSKLMLYPQAHPSIQGRLQHRQYDVFESKWNDLIWDRSAVFFELDDEGNVTKLRFKIRPEWIDPNEYVFIRKHISSNERMCGSNRE